MLCAERFHCRLRHAGVGVTASWARSRPSRFLYEFANVFAILCRGSFLLCPRLGAIGKRELAQSNALPHRALITSSFAANSEHRQALALELLLAALTSSAQLALNKTSASVNKRTLIDLFVLVRHQF